MKMSKLSKLKMPARKGMDASSLDASEGPEGMDDADEDKDNMDPQDMDSGDTDDMGEDPEAGPDDSDAPGASSDDLKKVSDDELLAEIKKRGLMAKLHQGADDSSDMSGGSADDQDMYR